MNLSRNGKRNPDGGFDWADALADAGIMGMLTFLTSLAGVSIIGMPSLIAPAIAGSIQFFAILAMKRGLVKK